MYRKRFASKTKHQQHGSTAAAHSDDAVPNPADFLFSRGGMPTHGSSKDLLDAGNTPESPKGRRNAFLPDEAPLGDPRLDISYRRRKLEAECVGVEREVCPFGVNCKNLHPEHFIRFQHSGDFASPEVAEEEDTGDEPTISPPTLVAKTDGEARPWYMVARNGREDRCASPIKTEPAHEGPELVSSDERGACGSKDRTKAPKKSLSKILTMKKKRLHHHRPPKTDMTPEQEVAFSMLLADTGVPVASEEDYNNQEVIGKFQLGKVLGRGGFGSVHAALNIHTGQLVAIKEIRSDRLSKEAMVSIMNEAELLKSLSHKNIVHIYGYVKTPRSLCLILEYMEGGSLRSMLESFGAFHEVLCASLIEQVLQGLEYLHSHNIIHRDIKAANVLMTKSGDIKLADFGESVHIEGSAIKRFSVVGTPFWMAPEVIEGSGHNTKSDVWSVGCLAHELIAGDPPYIKQTPWAAMFSIVSHEHPPFPLPVSEVMGEGVMSTAMSRFLIKCWNKDPDLRPDASSLLKLDWVSGEKNRDIPDMMVASVRVRGPNRVRGRKPIPESLVSVEDTVQFPTIPGTKHDSPVFPGDVDVSFSDASVSEQGEENVRESERIETIAEVLSDASAGIWETLQQHKRRLGGSTELLERELAATTRKLEAAIDSQNEMRIRYEEMKAMNEAVLALAETFFERQVPLSTIRANLAALLGKTVPEQGGADVKEPPVHMRERGFFLVQCGVCGLTYREEQALFKHIYAAHPVGSPVPRIRDQVDSPHHGDSY